MSFHSILFTFKIICNDENEVFFSVGHSFPFLLNSCSKDEELEQLDENSEVTTRALSGSVDMSLTGSTVSISWDQPFGEGIGITVTVFDNTGATYGSFSSEEDSGYDFSDCTYLSYILQVLSLH